MIIATMASHSAVHAQLDKRKYVQYSDISYAVRKNDLFFLHSEFSLVGSRGRWKSPP
jgi:hypothetical protein